METKPLSSQCAGVHPATRSYISRSHLKNESQVEGVKDVNYCTIMLMRLRLGVSVVQFTESSPSFPHIRMVLSPPHEARSVPLGLQLTNQQRESGCALNL